MRMLQLGYRMYRACFALAALLAVAGVFGQSRDESWVLTFDEEFEGNELSFPRWAPHDPWGHERNREGQAYVPEAIEVKDGVARLVARRARASYDGRPREFTSGMITTYGSFAQTYGRFEIRCRVAAGQGLESKFWLLPAPSGEVPAIDIVDVVGSEPAKALFGNRWGDERTERSYSGSGAVPDLSGAFHTIAIEWDEKRIIWSVDGKQTFESVSGVPHQAMYLVANLAVGGLTARYPDPAARFPAEFDIDYIRVYQLASRMPKPAR
jgi:beta-glucanase (GH16 family)